MARSVVFGLDMTLIVRDLSGSLDAWGHPLPSISNVPIKGYIWQQATADPDTGGTVIRDELRVGFLPPASGASPESFHSILFNGDTYEIVGEPEPKFSMANAARLHHYEVQVEAAAA